MPPYLLYLYFVRDITNLFFVFFLSLQFDLKFFPKPAQLESKQIQLVPDNDQQFTIFSYFSHLRSNSFNLFFFFCYVRLQKLKLAQALSYT